MKNVWLNKSGISLKLNPQRWSAVGGGVDCLLVWAALSIHYPDVQFWVGTKVDEDSLNDAYKKIYFPLGNVHFMSKVDRASPIGRKPDDTDISNDPHLTQFLRFFIKNRVKIDGALIDPGTGFQVNLPHTCLKLGKAGLDGSKAIPSMIGYAMSGPMVYTLNRLSEVSDEFKWAALHYDSKSMLFQRDLKIEPVTALGQMDATYETTRQVDGKLVDGTGSFKYAPLASSFCIGVDLMPADQLFAMKNKKLCAAVNGANTNKGAVNRWPDVQKIIESDPEVVVYGKWNEEHVPEDKQHLIGSKQLPGPLTKMQLDAESKTWRYTVLTAACPGWVTPKFYECVSNFVLPLFTPEYDRQKHLNVPKELRLEALSSEALADAMAFFEKGDRWREAVVWLRDEHVTEDVMSGKLVAETAMRAIWPDAPDGVGGDIHRDLWKRLNAQLSLQKKPSLDIFD